MSFASSFSAFNLRVPSSPAALASSTAAAAAAASDSSLNCQARKQSMLGSEIIAGAEDEEAEEQEEEQGDSMSVLLASEEPRFQHLDRSESNSPMLLQSPAMSSSALHPASSSSSFATAPLSTTPHHYGSAIRSNRSRSESAPSVPNSPTSAGHFSMSGGVSMMTPPSLLSRRRWSGMDEDAATTARTSSGASGSSGRGRELDREAGSMDMRQSSAIPDEGLLPSSSGSAPIDIHGPGSDDAGGRVVRRAVSRKPNLLPKPKSFLRVLRADEGQIDALEIQSEASLHRLSRSGTSAPFTSIPTPCPSTSIPQSSSSHSQPTRNRFPEHAEEEDEAQEEESEGSGEGEGGPGSDWMSMGYATDDDEERKASIWTGIRGGSLSSAAAIRSPGRSTSAALDMESAPATPAWSNSASNRPGKRKIGEERFEPYAQALKRRAVSPASASGHSPLIFPQTLSLPSPIPVSLAGLSSCTPTSMSNGISLPISIPSPTLGPHLSFFSALNNGMANSQYGTSRGASPGVSSTSSSWGRPSVFGNSMTAAGGARNELLGMMNAERDEEKSGRMGEAKAQLDSMSLG